MRDPETNFNSHTGDETSKSSYSACVLPSMPHEFIETRRESMISPTSYSTVAWSDWEEQWRRCKRRGGGGGRGGGGAGLYKTDALSPSLFSLSFQNALRPRDQIDSTSSIITPMSSWSSSLLSPSSRVSSSTSSALLRRDTERVFTPLPLMQILVMAVS